LATTATPPIRKHPSLESIFDDAEARHFKDGELETVLEIFPDLEAEAQACREIREVEKKVVKKVFREVFSQYDYEKHHENALAKCPRDVRYVVAYAAASMLFRDPAYFDDKILLWLRTILQAFEFPKRNVSNSGALFSDREFEEAVNAVPPNRQSIFHTYYRLRQEMGKAISAESFEKIEPYLTQGLNTLTEDYS
jgi:hypothetical protein